MNTNTILLISRIFLAFIFIMAGLQKLGGIAGTAGYIASVGLPAASLLAWLAAIFEVVAGVAILVGFKTQLTSYLLAVFCLFTGFVFHFNLGDNTQTIMLMKNIAMAGGFLALAVAGPGALSVDGRRAQASDA